MKNGITPIETVYKGYRFRSRLEARWAVFFDAMGVKWEYEPQGYVLDDGTAYLPDFYLHINRRMWHGEPKELSGCFVEVKGEMTEEDEQKIKRFSNHRPIIVLGNIPENDKEYWNVYCDTSIKRGITYNSYLYIDGDEYCAFFSTVDGKPWIIGSDHDGWDRGKSMNTALQKARQSRFEHGEMPAI